MKNYILLSIFFLTFLFTLQQASAQVIPSPTFFEEKEGKFILKKKVKIYSDAKNPYLWELFEKDIFTSAKIEKEKTAKKAIISLIHDSIIQPEGYYLDVTEENITINAADENGFLYALQTLRQLVQYDDEKVTINCVSVKDAPRIQFRSFMLDSGRQYQRISTLKKYLDLLSILKINFFHWHLTEGLGWRIEIKNHPNLALIGSKVGGGKEQHGYYTQEDIREILIYAQERGITVVPEIDMPGHAEAALYAYPEYSCFNETIKIPENGFTEQIFCAGKDRTIKFLKEILDEVTTLFPSEYIHIGGDEAPKGNWNKCLDCKKRMEKHKLKNSHELQLWFTAEIANYLKNKGKKVVCWGDVVRHGEYPLPNNIVIHWWNWRGHKDQAFQKAKKKGLPVICGTNYYTYLNFPVEPWSVYNEDRTFNIKDVYLSNPSYSKLSDPAVLGMSCALWTDGGLVEELLDERIFPRIFAIAEQMWYQNELIPFDQFYKKIEAKKQWYKDQGYNYGPVFSSNQQP